MAVGTPAAACAQTADDSAPPIVNSGNDLSRLNDRIEIRTELARDDGDDVLITTLRVDHRFATIEDWVTNLRTDLPLHVAGSGDAGPELGDWRVEVTTVKRRTGGRAYGFGVRAVIPTSETSEWRSMPYAGYRWPIDGAPGESFFQLIAR